MNFKQASKHIQFCLALLQYQKYTTARLMYNWKHKNLCFQFSFINFQVFLSMFMGSYSLYTSVVLWVYPLNDFVGDIACYMFIYARNIGFTIIQVHSFFVTLFRYLCLFHGNLLLRFSLSSNVSRYILVHRQSIFNGM